MFLAIVLELHLRKLIGWARDNAPGVTFDFMSVRPLLVHGDAMYSEVARILRPGGWFFVSFCAYSHIMWSASGNRRKFPLHMAMLADIEKTGNYFQPINYAAEESDTDEHWGIQSTTARPFSPSRAKTSRSRRISRALTKATRAWPS
ncbi:MAG: hypothetical protein KJP04_00150 [Arenicella sp.]|nr:hypothetical protein [Arenicella sp.]